MWFSDTFWQVPSIEINDKTNFSFFDELVVPKLEIPRYRFILTKRPKNIKPVRSVGEFNKIYADNNIDTRNLNAIYNNTLNKNNQPSNNIVLPAVNKNESYVDNLHKFKNMKGGINAKNSLSKLNSAKITHSPSAKRNTIGKYQTDSQKRAVRHQSLANQFIQGRRSPRNFQNTNKSNNLTNTANLTNTSTLNSSFLNEENEQSIEKQKKERKILSGIGGYDYLIQSIGTITPRIEEQIFFDSDEACNALQIINFESKYSFSENIIKYAEEFFGHVEKLLDSKMVEQEAKISLKLFRRFTTLCLKKEAAMVNSVFDLRDTLINYATNKCTHEMENFARKFRYLKQGGTKLRSPLFVYDMTRINEDVLHLADLALMLHSPIHDQELLSVPSMLKIAQQIVNKGQICTSLNEFLETARECELTEFEMLKLELALRVIECIECFNSKKFLESFIRTKIDSAKLNDIFNRPPQNIIIQKPKVFPQRPSEDDNSLSQLSDLSYGLEEEEEEEFEEEDVNDVDDDDDDDDTEED